MYNKNKKYRKAQKYNRETKSTVSTGEEGWETPLPARVNHTPSSGDLSLPVRATCNRKPQTAEAVGGGEESWPCMRWWKRTFLACATHALGSWSHNEKRLVSVEAEDDGNHGGEVRGMQRLAEMRRSRFQIFDPKTLPKFAINIEDVGDGRWFLCWYKKRKKKQ